MSTVADGQRRGGGLARLAGVLPLVLLVLLYPLNTWRYAPLLSTPNAGLDGLAGRELPVGRWRVSLDFEAVDLQHRARLDTANDKSVWVSRTPSERR